MSPDTTLLARARGAILGVESSAPDAEALMGLVLRGNPRALAPEYPLVFGEGAPGELLVLRDEDGTPLSACATLLREWEVSGRRFRAGLIGSVATDASCRGIGLGARLLEGALAHLRERGCLFAMLWADEPGFYERRGFVRFGSERNHVLDPHVVGIPEGLEGRVRPFEPGDLARVHELHAAHSQRIERTQEELRQLLAIPGMTILVHEQAGEVDGYACAGKGGDLQGVVHDWGGAPGVVLSLAHAHATALDHPVVVLGPEPGSPHSSFFEQAGMFASTGILGMGVLLDVDRARHMAQDASISQLDELFPPGAPGGPLWASPFAWGLDSI